jgi:hypothetical protein
MEWEWVNDHIIMISQAEQQRLRKVTALAKLRYDLPIGFGPWFQISAGKSLPSNASHFSSNLSILRLMGYPTKN